MMSINNRYFVFRDRKSLQSLSSTQIFPCLILFFLSWSQNFPRGEREREMLDCKSHATLSLRVTQSAATARGFPFRTKTFFFLPFFTGIFLSVSFHFIRKGGPPPKKKRNSRWLSIAFSYGRVYSTNSSRWKKLFFFHSNDYYLQLLPSVFFFSEDWNKCGKTRLVYLRSLSARFFSFSGVFVCTSPLFSPYLIF